MWSLFAARDWAQTQLTTPESTAAWEAWREDVRAEQDQPTPVQRRVPKSAEPPALVLTRDYFGVSLGGAVLFSSLLYWVIAWFVTGILTRRNSNEGGSSFTRPTDRRASTDFSGSPSSDRAHRAARRRGN